MIILPFVTAGALLEAIQIFLHWAHLNRARLRVAFCGYWFPAAVAELALVAGERRVSIDDRFAELSIPAMSERWHR